MRAVKRNSVVRAASEANAAAVRVGSRRWVRPQTAQCWEELRELLGEAPDGTLVVLEDADKNPLRRRRLAPEGQSVGRADGAPQAPPQAPQPSAAEPAAPTVAQYLQWRVDAMERELREQARLLMSLQLAMVRLESRTVYGGGDGDGDDDDYDDELSRPAPPSFMNTFAAALGRSAGDRLLKDLDGPGEPKV